jgi:hypothetical protein
VKELIAIFKEAFRARTLIELAAKQLADSERECLNARASLEWTQAQIACYNVRIARLKAYITEQTAKVES